MFSGYVLLCLCVALGLWLSGFGGFADTRVYIDGISDLRRADFGLCDRLDWRVWMDRIDWS